ncbi:helix-turn-helix transcriptional regulator [Haliangium sp. UPWRP_2]|uniref:helix-turn-helix domain-containing protein n=1 Tax=Haliangium sp. UPWRP_2 TaxID=1931276 RepID=UPI000B5484FC|nr:helix-turn-helix transcriptional regulator [Haliangium sp. UPWRP_2]PSM31675.1 XRE family transcriptional regulator [Haliangium sp. UPWRP_2]
MGPSRREPGGLFYLWGVAKVRISSRRPPTGDLDRRNRCSLLRADASVIARNYEQAKCYASAVPRPDLKAPKSSLVGERLKWARARANMTIRELSHAASVPNSSITEIELGNRIPRSSTLEKIANALKIAPCWLAFGDGAAPEGWDERKDLPTHR